MGDGIGSDHALPGDNEHRLMIAFAEDIDVIGALTLVVSVCGRCCCWAAANCIPPTESPPPVSCPPEILFYAYLQMQTSGGAFAPPNSNIANLQTIPSPRASWDAEPIYPKACFCRLVAAPSTSVIAASTASMTASVSGQ